MNKNTIPVIIIAIVIICLGLGGLALVIYNIKRDGKDGEPDVKPSGMMHHYESDDSMPDPTAPWGILARNDEFV